MHYITGDEVDKNLVMDFARKCSFSLWPTKSNPLLSSIKSTKVNYPTHLSIIAGHITEPKLNSLFTLPINFILDANALPESISDFTNRQQKDALDYSLGFLLTCPEIYRCDVAKLFTEALNRRISFSVNRYSGIQMALHEALVNGLIHGNLQIDSELRQTARDFIEYSNILNERLNNPEYAQKAISMWATWDKKKLVITIRDEGAGYAISSPKIVKKPNTGKSGRGLFFIASTADSCTIDDFGREISLYFSLTSTETMERLEPFPVSYSTEIETLDFAQSKVVVIEDNLSNQTLVLRLLNVLGINNIEVATDGLEGLNKVFEVKPDLVILDLTMPRMSGYEVLHHLKNSKDSKDIPVLIQTASDTRETRDKTFSSGATDFINKPLNPLEFFSRVRVHLQNRLLIKHLQEQLSRVDLELTTAQHMQEELLPSKKRLSTVLDRYNLDIAQYFKSSSWLGGDFWQIFPLNETQVAMYICDFSGHGVSAALNTFRMHTLMTNMLHRVKRPATTLKLLNKQLLGLLPRGQFATFLMGIFDIKEKTFTYAGAGAPSPILLHRNKLQLLDATGLPLGISHKAIYTDKIIHLDSNNSLFFYSDAFVETPDKNGKLLGETGLLKKVSKHLKKNLSTEHILNPIVNDFYAYTPNPPQDDVTAVLIKVLNHD